MKINFQTRVLFSELSFRILQAKAQNIGKEDTLLNRGISVSVSGKCTAKADCELISRALENLISNAVKYTSDGGKVEITVSEKQFSISNSCDEKLTGKTEDFCKPLGKADTSRSERKGSGMGLAIVKILLCFTSSGLKLRAENLPQKLSLNKNKPPRCCTEAAIFMQARSL